MSEDRFLPIAMDENAKGNTQYTDTINIAVKDKNEKALMWQFFIPKDEPQYGFKNSENHFYDFSKKVLRTFRFAGFTRARLYMAKYIKHQVLEDDKIVTEKTGKYFSS